MGHQQQEVDLPQLFSDVSRTVSGIKNILGGVDSPAPQADAMISGSGGLGSTATSGPSRSGGGLSSLFGGGDVCFKTCGMEDIQFAARSTGDMMITLRVCIVVATITLVICALLLTITAMYVACKRNPPRRPMMPSCISDLFIKTKNNNKDDLSHS